MPSDAPRDSDEHIAPTDLDDIANEGLDDLRRTAQGMLRRERRSHTLSPTALVNEAFLRLAGQRKRTWESREGLLAAAALMMKRILSNYGRDRNTLKRGGTRARVDFLEIISERDDGEPRDVVRECLVRLMEIDPRAAEIAYMRLYRGVSHEVIADLMGVSTRTVEREWAATRAWLRAELSEGDAS